MKQLNVLSIDFDFFQIVDKETLTTKYPDGLDLETSLTEFTWSQYYASNNSIEDLVSVDKEKLLEIVEIVSKQDFQTPIMIANSHKHIYDFILEHKGDSQKLNLVNIDLHHDMFNNNDNVDCGNWVKHIVKKFDDYNLSWITRKVSKEVYDLDDNIPIKYDFREIKDEKFDIIFICRSDTWLPPHLDTDFDNLYKLVINLFKEIKVDSQITKPRNLKEIKKLAKMHESMDLDFLRKREQ